MGLNEHWQDEVISTLQQFEIEVKMRVIDGFDIINCVDKLHINLVSLNNLHLPKDLVKLQTDSNKQGFTLIHLWQDVWETKQTQVLSRIHSFLGLNERIHARKTKVVPVDQQKSIHFLSTYHLQGYVKSKYNFGLIYNEELVALASFSEPRPMKSRGDNYQSAELVRFASKNGLTIVGGLSKLINFFIKQITFDDVMTYADRDWSLGKGYQQLDFTFTAETPPAYLYLDTQSLIRYFPHRLPKPILSAFESQNTLNLEAFLLQNHYVKVFNTGNLKYHLYL